MTSCVSSSRSDRRGVDVSRFLDPAVLGALSGLDLVAKTVVEGFIAGLHRSADLGLSQDFAEYRAYTAGDDLRNIDWNVFARTDRAYIKRYQGETNTQVTVLLDASNSMNYTSHAVTKMNYARFMAAAIFYLALRKQRDGAGLLVFDDAVRNYVGPSARHGQFLRLLSGLELAEARARTNFAEALRHVQGLLRRKGIVVILSDFYEAPRTLIRAIEPLCIRGNEVVLFHILDPRELRFRFGGPSTVLVDLETRARMEVTAEYTAKEYSGRIARHIEALRDGAQRAGMGYQQLVTDRPLDGALREYLTLRQGRQ
jgi:uncharacterized protein (DUF58 family)